MEVLKIFCSLSSKGLNYSTYKLLLEEKDKIYIDNLKGKRYRKDSLLIPMSNMKNMLPCCVISYFILCETADRKKGKRLVKEAIMNRYDELKNSFLELTGGLAL